MRSAVGGNRGALAGRQYAGILIGEFEGKLRCAQTRQGLKLAAQSVAMGRLLLQDRLIGSECGEIIATQHRNCGIGFEHINA